MSAILIVRPGPHDFQADIDLIGSIEAFPTILDVVCRTTGMGFAAVARVTESRWIARRVKDDISFGLEPGGKLQVESTICHEVCERRTPVAIKHEAEDKLQRLRMLRLFEQLNSDGQTLCRTMALVSFGVHVILPRWMLTTPQH